MHFTTNPHPLRFIFSVKAPLRIAGLVAVLLAGLGACKDKDLNPTEELTKNLSFTKVVENSAFAAANAICVSPNGQYMIFSDQSMSNSFKYYFSKDGGATAQELFIHRTSMSNNMTIETNISNKGRFIVGDGGVYDLNNNQSGAGALHYGTAITDSDQLVHIQNDGANGLTFFLDNNGTYESTGVRLGMDLRYFVGASGEKLGFFDHASKTIGEFDVTTQTYTQTTLNDLDYSLIGGFGQWEGTIRTAYSQSYFAYAKSGGLLIISPDHSIRYYPFPQELAGYENTSHLRMFGDGYAYVNLKGMAYEAFGDGSIRALNVPYPVMRSGESLYRSGFLENGSRYISGIIERKGNSEQYLPLSFSESYFPVAPYAVGNHIYLGDKRYSREDATFSTSPIGEIVNVFHDANQTIAYTSTGTYTTNDGTTWQLQATDQPSPELVAKDADGVYHALDIRAYNYVPPGTGFSYPQFDQVGYVSNNGITWTIVSGSVKNGLVSHGPKWISGDGVVAYTANENPDGNQDLQTYVSYDYGVTYERNNDLENPQVVMLPRFWTKSGRFVSAFFEFSGELNFWVCTDALDGCSNSLLGVNFNSADLYGRASMVTLSDKDELVVPGNEGIYLSGSLR